MKGFFLVLSNNQNEKFDIRCELHQNIAKDEVPKEQEDLYVEVEKTNNVIKSLINTKDDIKKKYFEKLLSLAQAGLVGETAQPKLSLKSLEELKEEMLLIEGQRIKNYYMKKLGIAALIIGSIPTALYLLLVSHFSFLSNFTMYIMVWIGAMIGTWISFGARKFIISFEELSILEKDMMSTYIRLIYVALCSIVFILFLNSHIISINIGKTSTANINSSGELQIIIGIICGLVESKLGINIYKKATDIIGS